MDDLRYRLAEWLERGKAEAHIAERAALKAERDKGRINPGDPADQAAVDADLKPEEQE